MPLLHKYTEPFGPHYQQLVTGKTLSDEENLSCFAVFVERRPVEARHSAASTQRSQRSAPGTTGTQPTKDRIYGGTVPLRAGLKNADCDRSQM